MVENIQDNRPTAAKILTNYKIEVISNDRNELVANEKNEIINEKHVHIYYQNLIPKDILLNRPLSLRGTTRTLVKITTTEVFAVKKLKVMSETLSRFSQLNLND